MRWFGAGSTRFKATCQNEHENKLFPSSFFLVSPRDGFGDMILYKSHLNRPTYTHKQTHCAEPAQTAYRGKSSCSGNPQKALFIQYPGPRQCVSDCGLHERYQRAIYKLCSQTSRSQSWPTGGIEKGTKKIPILFLVVCLMCAFHVHSNRDDRD